VRGVLRPLAPARECRCVTPGAPGRSGSPPRTPGRRVQRCAASTRGSPSRRVRATSSRPRSRAAMACRLDSEGACGGALGLIDAAGRIFHVEDRAAGPGPGRSGVVVALENCPALPDAGSALRARPSRPGPHQSAPPSICRVMRHVAAAAREALPQRPRPHPAPARREPTDVDASSGWAHALLQAPRIPSAGGLAVSLGAPAAVPQSRTVATIPGSCDHYPERGA